MSNVSLEEVAQAYLDCRKNKRNKPGTIEFEQDLESNLINIRDEINSDTYKIRATDYFILTNPKDREVWAACFRDRIVHRVVYNRICNKYFKRFIYDSCACIPGRGPLFASNRVHKFIHSPGSKFYLQADIKNFFVSINKDILWNLVEDQMEGLEPLTYQILYHDPTINYTFKGDTSLKSLVPAHKSLFNAKPYCGLPIGNLPSQLFANIYLDIMDKFAKHRLKIKYYVRYVDDIVILHDNPKQLNKWYWQLSEFINKELALEFHPNKVHINVSERGINFAGKIIKPYRTYPRKRIVNSFYRVPIDGQETLSTISSLNSYIGILSQANSWRTRTKMEHYLNNNGLLMDKQLTKVLTPVKEYINI